MTKDELAKLAYTGSLEAYGYGGRFEGTWVRFNDATLAIQQAEHERDCAVEKLAELKAKIEQQERSLRRYQEMTGAEVCPECKIENDFHELDCSQARLAVEPKAPPDVEKLMNTMDAALREAGFTLMGGGFLPIAEPNSEPEECRHEWLESVSRPGTRVCDLCGTRQRSTLNRRAEHGD